MGLPFELDTPTPFTPEDISTWEAWEFKGASGSRTRAVVPCRVVPTGPDETENLPTQECGSCPRSVQYFAGRDRPHRSSTWRDVRHVDCSFPPIAVVGLQGGAGPVGACRVGREPEGGKFVVLWRYPTPVHNPESWGKRILDTLRRTNVTPQGCPLAAYTPKMPSGVYLSPTSVNDAIAAAFPRAATVACVEIESTTALVKRDIDPLEHRPGGFVSGPSQFALADSALWYLTFGVIDRIELMALTSQLDITFLRPAIGLTLWARAELLSAGTRTIVGSVKLWCDEQADRPCSVAKGAYVLPREGPTT